MNSDIEKLILAANALLLVRGRFKVEQQKSSNEQRKTLRRIDREDYSNFQDLIHYLHRKDLVDPGVEPRFELLVKPDAEIARLQAFINSNDPVARFRFQDVSFRAKDKRRLQQANGGPLSWDDQLRPICHWWPCQTIWTARDIVLAQLQELDKKFERLPDSGHQGPRPPKKIRAERELSRLLEEVHASTELLPLKPEVAEIFVPMLGTMDAFD